MALAIAATEITTAPTIAKLVGFGSLPIYCRKKLPAIPDARIIAVVTGEPLDTAAAIKKKYQVTVDKVITMPVYHTVYPKVVLGITQSGLIRNDDNSH